MYHGCQFLFSFKRREFRVMMLESGCHTAVEISRCEFHGMRGHDSGVKAIEPARFPMVPWPVLDDGMVANAISLRLRKCAVRDLVHPHGARCWPVHVERTWLPGPAPVCLRHRIPGTLHLRERREQFGCNDIRGVVLKEWPVSTPGLFRDLVQGAAD